MKSTDSNGNNQESPKKDPNRESKELRQPDAKVRMLNQLKRSTRQLQTIPSPKKKKHSFFKKKKALVLWCLPSKA